MNDKQIYAYIRLAIALSEVITLVDYFQGTTMYRHDLKQDGNRFLRTAEKHYNKAMADIVGLDDNALYRQMDYHSELLSEMCELSTEESAVIAEIIRDYKKNPAKYMADLKLEIKENGR